MKNASLFGVAISHGRSPSTSSTSTRSAMTPPPFITLNQQDTISLAQAFRLLQNSGDLDAFISSILRQHLLERELQENPAVAVLQTEVDQQALAFRKQNDLLDSFVFQQWLASKELDADLFYTQIAYQLGLEKLRQHVGGDRLQEYFIERKLFLDRVILSRIVVNDQELAAELYSQLRDGASFENLAWEYSVTEDRYMNGMFGMITRGNLPDTLRAALDVSVPGSILQPLPLEDHWFIFRFEHSLPATLDDPQVQQTLLEELLDQWFMEQLKSLNVDIQVQDEPTAP